MALNIRGFEYTPMQTIDANGLRALANPRRLAILHLLGRGERGVGEIQRLIGIDQSAVN